jgi:hypothetical protein
MDQVQISHRPGPERHAKRRISILGFHFAISVSRPAMTVLGSPKPLPSFSAIFLEFDQIVLACAEQRCHLVEHIRLPAA